MKNRIEIEIIVRNPIKLTMYPSKKLEMKMKLSKNKLKISQKNLMTNKKVNKIERKIKVNKTNISKKILSKLKNEMVMLKIKIVVKEAITNGVVIAEKIKNNYSNNMRLICLRGCVQAKIKLTSPVEAVQIEDNVEINLKTSVEAFEIHLLKRMKIMISEGLAQAMTRGSLSRPWCPVRPEVRALEWPGFINSVGTRPHPEITDEATVLSIEMSLALPTDLGVDIVIYDVVVGKAGDMITMAGQAGIRIGAQMITFGVKIGVVRVQIPITRLTQTKLLCHQDFKDHVTKTSLNIGQGVIIRDHVTLRMIMKRMTSTRTLNQQQHVSMIGVWRLKKRKNDFRKRSKKTPTGGIIGVESSDCRQMQ